MSTIYPRYTVRLLTGMAVGAGMFTVWDGHEWCAVGAPFYFESAAETVAARMSAAETQKHQI